MSELPRTDELPRSDEGYDAAKVEEAFASFADRVHELESVAGELRAELSALRADRQRADRQRLAFERAPATYESEEWPAADGAAADGAAAASDWSSAGWVSSVPAPLSRPIVVPRLALEAVFLVLVALLAGLADLSTTSIVIVMAAAWALVVLSEWAAAAKRARWRLDSVATPVDELAPGAGDSTGRWSMPVVEATVVEAPDRSESHTVVTKLPPEPAAEPEPVLEAQPEPEPEPKPEPEPELEPDPAAAVEDTAEIGAPIPPAEPEPEPEDAPKRRRWFRRGRKDEPEADAPDPWEL